MLSFIGLKTLISAMLFWIYVRVRELLAVFRLRKDCWYCPNKLFFKSLCIFPLAAQSDQVRDKLRSAFKTLSYVSA